MSDETPDILTPTEADHLLAYPRGRSARLARRGLLPHITMPDGEIRFLRAGLLDWLREQQQIPALPTEGGER